MTVWKGGILFAKLPITCFTVPPFALPFSLSLSVSLLCGLYVYCLYFICLWINVEMSFVSLFVSFFSAPPPALPLFRSVPLSLSLFLHAQKHANSILFTLFCFAFVRGWLISVHCSHSAAAAAAALRNCHVSAVKDRVGERQIERARERDAEQALDPASSHSLSLLLSFSAAAAAVFIALNFCCTVVFGRHTQPPAHWATAECKQNKHKQKKNQKQEYET